MQTEIEAARALTWRAARLKDADRPHTVEGAQAKLFASAVARRVTGEAIQVLGGYGYTRELPRRALLPRREGHRDLRGHLGDPAPRHRPRAARRSRARVARSALAAAGVRGAECRGRLAPCAFESCSPPSVPPPRSPRWRRSSSRSAPQPKTIDVDAEERQRRRRRHGHASRRPRRRARSTCAPACAACSPASTAFTSTPSADCVAPAFTSAIGHLKAAGQSHGDHVGDMSSLLVKRNGTATLRLTTDRFTLADLRDADGSAVMVHAGPDNFANIPPRYAPDGPDQATLDTGDSGARVACGAIAPLG